MIMASANDLNGNDSAANGKKQPSIGLFGEWVLHLLLVVAVVAALIEGAVGLNSPSII
jgi:hypothetical protein